MLAGADARDDAPVAPLDPSVAPAGADLYLGNLSWPPVDAVDLWPHLAGERADPANFSAARTSLALSAEALVRGSLKLVVAQPDPSSMASETIESGWRWRNGSGWEDDGGEAAWGCGAYANRSRFAPCLFDLAADPAERSDLAASRPDVVADLWAELNLTQRTAYASRSPAALVGACNATCADAAWAPWGGGPGPVCGVPGCG